MNRRDFAALAPALLSLTTFADAQFTGPAGKDPKPSQAELKQLQSGTYKPGPGYGSLPKRVSHRYLIGTLAAGNIRLEMHETIQEVGAEHEPVDTHLHNELWMVKSGSASLFVNGTEHPMAAGDIGLVCAGDKHWIKNVGDTPLTYFVVTLGPPEP